MVAMLVESQNTVRVNCVGSSSSTRRLWATRDAHGQRLALRVGLGNGVKSRLVLVRATAVTAMVAAARLSVPFNGWLQMGTFARLLTTVTLDMGRARLAHGATVRALGNWSTLLVDMLKWTVRMLTVAHTMAADAGLAGILFSINYHFGGGCELV